MLEYQFLEAPVDANSKWLAEFDSLMQVLTERAWEARDENGFIETAVKLLAHARKRP